MRGVGEIDLGRPRWREDPKPIMQVLQSYLQIEDPDQAPDAVFARGAAAAEAAIEHLAEEVRAGAGRLVQGPAGALGGAADAGPGRPAREPQVLGRACHGPGPRGAAGQRRGTWSRPACWTGPTTCSSCTWPSSRPWRRARRGTGGRWCGERRQAYAREERAAARCRACC